MGEFVESLGVQQYNVSKQLKMLSQACLLKSVKEGRNVYYELAPEAEMFHQLIAALPDEDGFFEADLRHFSERVVAPARRRVSVLKKEEDKEVGDEEEVWEDDTHLPSNLL